MRLSSNNKRGFTLIELMVSVAIFAVVMVISLGALLSISNADRKADTVSSVVSNLNFAIESMTRAIRTGYNYNCGSANGKDCTNGGTSIYFRDQDGNTTMYAFSAIASTCGQPSNAAVVGCIVRSINGGTSLPITADEVKITNMKFYLRGSNLGSSGDTQQPNIVLSVVGYVQLSTSTQASTASQRSPFNIQTSVTQRLYDK